MAVVKVENTDIDNLSPVTVGSDIKYTGNDIPVSEAGLISIKYNENDEKGENNFHSLEVGIKTETTDIKDEVVEEDELSYEQLRDYKIDCGDEYMQPRATQCCVSLNKLDIDNGRWHDNLETIKCEQNIKKEDGIEVDIEKQNAARKYQSNCCKYERGDIARHSNNKSNTEHQSLLFIYKAKEEPALQTVTHEANVKYFKCHFCEYITKQRYELKLHFTKKHDESAELYQCFNCEYKTKLKTHLKLHFQRNHDKRIEWHQCLSCDFRTKYKFSLLQHCRLKHDKSAEIFHCKLCDFKTNWKHNLLKHYNVRHVDAAEIFHCEMCDYKTKMRSYLLHHLRVMHNSARIFQCKLCDFKTKYKRNLLMHHESKHSGGTFHCEMCDYKTECKKIFLRHYRSKHKKSVDALQL